MQSLVSRAQAVYTCAQAREHPHEQQEKARPVSLLNLLWTSDSGTIYRTGVSEVDVLMLDVHYSETLSNAL